MSLDRRQFVMLTVSAAVGVNLCGCAGGPMADDDDEKFAVVRGPVDAGPVAAYATDGVYDQFSSRGFFIVRKGESLTALSSQCTHRRCRVRKAAGTAFRCPCHGSTFGPAGRVTKGPAKRDLPAVPLRVDGAGHVIVEVAAE